jgi:L-threonylcarbamoyladenylate synthase
MIQTDQIRDIIEALKNDQVVAFPTETSYGLLANALKSETVERILKIKDRNPKDKLSILVKDENQAKELVFFNPQIEKIFQHFFQSSNKPALTIVCKAKKEIFGITKNKTIALRVSSSKRVREIFKSINFPLTATSANITGDPDLYSEAALVRIYKQRQDQPDVVFSGGEIEKRPPSTIVDLTGSEPKIIRQGQIKLEEINKVLAE